MRREPMYPPGIEKLPLDDAPAGAGDGMTIQFVGLQQGVVVARVYDDTYLMLVDEVRGYDFMDAYTKVIDEYPQAKWTPRE